MKCDEFREWLLRREEFQDISEKEVDYHIRDCSDCRRLYSIDSALEDLIGQALKKEAPIPDGLVRRIELDLNEVGSVKKDYPFLNILYRIAVPVSVVAVILFLVIFYPSRDFHSVEEIGRLAIKSHLSDFPMEFRVEDTMDISAWFRDRLSYQVSPPDIKGLKLMGGRKCSLGSNEVAYLFYNNSKNEKVSVFVIDPDRVDFDIQETKDYQLFFGNRAVKVWKKNGLVYAMVE